MNAPSTFIEPLGWALLHFLWQGAAIAFLLRGFLWLTRRRSPQARYAAAGAALLLMLGTAVATVWWQMRALRADVAVKVDGKNETDGRNGKVANVALPAASPSEPPSHSSLPSHASHPLPPEAHPLPAAPSPQLTAADRLRPLLPWMVGGWAAGVLFFSLRLLNAWRVVRQWRSSANNAIPADWEHRFARLSERLRVTRAVRLLSSATLAVPVVIGWLRPVVLVPASLFTGLSAPQLEALLAHELAHVRRHDYLVNLLQSALETLFFYHPAVWWVSGQLRKEREHCCDDTAAALAGGVLDYARALTALEEMRALPVALGVSAAGGPLLQRIRRLAGVADQRSSDLAWPLGLLTLAAVAVALPFTLLHAAPEDAHAAAKPKHEQTADLLRLWRGEYIDAPAVPAEAMKRLAVQVKEFIEKHPGEPAEKMKPLLPELEKDHPWAWDKAQTTIDSLCDAATAPAGWLALREEFRSFDRVEPGQKWTEQQLAKLPFGEADKRGLRAAWIFDPMQNSYAAGTLLKCRILFHNSGKEAVEFRTDQWHQDDAWLVTNAAGAEVKVKTTWFSGVTPWQKFHLDPGQVCEVTGHGVGIGEGKYEESYSTAAIGAEIPAKPGDQLTCQWKVSLRPSWRESDKPQPEAGSVPDSLTTGTVTIKVTAPDPNAAPKVGKARGTGKFHLAAGIKLQVSQLTSSQDGSTTRTNTATIEWYGANGQVGMSWPIELMPGVDIDPIIWQRGGSALWIVHEKAIRKLDFTNATDVKEQNWKWESAGDFGGAPQEVRAEIEKLRPKIAQVPLPSTVLEIRLVADREGPETEPMEYVENWSDLPAFHLNKTVILTAADVKSATVESDKEPGRWRIKLVFTEEGGATLVNATKENFGRQLAIVGNGKVISAPVIQGEIGKQVTLSGNYLESEARELVKAIQSAASTRGAAIEPALPPGGKVPGKAQEQPEAQPDIPHREVKRQISLAQGFYDLGQYEKARDGYELALKLDPSNEGVRKLMEQAISKLAHQSNPYAVPKDPKTLAEARQKSISMSVLDSTGQKPLAEFRVIAGVRSGVGGGKDVVNWQPHTLQTGTSGGLLWPLDKAYDEMALRVEADGYMPQVFNWLEKKKGPQDLVFQMVEVREMPVRILGPDGKPAAGAVAALAMVQRDAVIEGGKLRHFDEARPEKASDGWRWPRIIKADADGKILLPAENDPTAALLIVHESGVREISLAEFHRENPGPDVNRDGLEPVDRGQPITLQPWGRIEGKVQWGDKAGAGQRVSLTIHRDSYGYPGVIAQYEKTTAAADGSFVFEKVLPGRCKLSCPIAAEPGNKRGVTEINLTVRIAHVEVKPGPNEAVIGGGGRPVKGKLRGRDSWDGVTFHFHPDAPRPGDDEMWKAILEFKKSPAGPLFFREGLKVNADGTFEITGVLPGHYQIFFKREGEDEYLTSGKFSVEAELPGKKLRVLTLPEMEAAPPTPPASEPDKKKTSDAAPEHPRVRKFEDGRHTAWVIKTFDGSTCTILHMGKAQGSFQSSYVVISLDINMLRGEIKTAGGRVFNIGLDSSSPGLVRIDSETYKLTSRPPAAVSNLSPPIAGVSSIPMRLLVLREEGTPVQLGCEKLLQSVDDLPEIVRIAETGLTETRTKLNVPEIGALEHEPSKIGGEHWLKLPFDDSQSRWTVPD